VLLNTVKSLRTIQPIVYILGLAGGALFIVLLIRKGAEQVGLAISRAGWGLLAVVLSSSADAERRGRLVGPDPETEYSSPQRSV